MTESLKYISITQDMIDEFARGDATNNPVVVAIKLEHFPQAKEIIFHGDEIYIDSVLYRPTVKMVRWMNAWNTDRPVEPCILGYRI